MKIILASSNLGKIREFRAILKDFPVKLITLPELKDIPTIHETGSTFAANALIKAHSIAMHFQQITIGEDSGLEVPALQGEPGVYSARYAKRMGMISSEPADIRALDRANIRVLLSRMEGLSGEKRRAFFRCVIAVVDPATGRRETIEGSLAGVITSDPRGGNGFGYDPVFLVDGKNRTLAEMSDAEKNLISHRAQALARFKEIIPSFINL